MFICLGCKAIFTEPGGRLCQTEKHHVFSGALRKLSEKFGLWVWLCHWCHNEPPDGIHHNAENNRLLKARVQIRAMYIYGWTVEQFRKIFRKSYIDDTDNTTD